MVSVEQGISALGFRRIAAIARQLDPSADICFIPVGNLYSMITHIFPRYGKVLQETDNQVIADDLATADLVCFSSLTPSAPYVTALAKRIREKNPRTFLVWGGSHCILSPEDAIPHVDAVCTGEGQIPFQRLYAALANETDYLSIPGMWFNTPQGVVRNPNRPLYTGEELQSFPHPFEDLSCRIYDVKRHRFRPLNKHDYIRYNGLAYRTIWTMGCPFSCTYCCNSAFIGIDKEYGKIRYPSVPYLLDEIEHALKVHPYVSTIVFHDDNFIAVPRRDLEVFAQEYSRRIGLPFVVFGMHPNLITREKVELLARAGMNRTRMGIQSFSPATLSFYNRGTPLERIRTSGQILAQATREFNMIPPAYDIISDNPVESRHDLLQTLENLYNLPRPYTLTLFSLRAFEKTQLWEYFAKNPHRNAGMGTSYLHTRKTMVNVLLYLLGAGKPPETLFRLLLRRVQGGEDQQKQYPLLHLLAKLVWLTRRGFSHLRKCDFTTLGGRPAYLLWKLGLIGRPKATARLL